MYNEEMLKKQLKFLTDTVLKFFVIIITCLILSFLSKA